jgi:hypothetical protein
LKEREEKVFFPPRGFTCFEALEAMPTRPSGIGTFKKRLKRWEVRKIKCQEVECAMSR